MRYTLIIQEETELEETWPDANIPNMMFCFNELSLEDCVALADGTFEASYETFDVTEVSVFHYIDEAGITYEYTLQPGEYGIRPNSRRA